MKKKRKNPTGDLFRKKDTPWSEFLKNKIYVFYVVQQSKDEHSQCHKTP